MTDSQRDFTPVGDVVKSCVLKIVAATPNAPLAVLQKLAQDQAELERVTVAANPETPLELLQNLAQDQAESVRVTVAENRSVSVELLAHLANDTSVWVRWHVACHPNTPPEVLDRLSQDEYQQVCKNVAANPNTPVEALNRLATIDEYDEYKYYIKASLSKRSEDQLCQLAAKCNSELAKIMADFHKVNPLPMRVLQAGLRGSQRRTFIEVLDKTPSITILQLSQEMIEKNRDTER